MMTGPPRPVPDVSGFVVAGGRSSRFGSDKRRFEIDGRSLLQLSIERVAAVVASPVGVVGDDLDAFDLPTGARRLRDAAPRSGPVGGLVAALEAADTDWILVTAVDMPRLTPADLRAIVESRDPDLDAVALADAGRIQPLAALYHSRTAGFWRRRLEGGALSLVSGLVELRTRAVPPPGGAESLRNLNTRADAGRDKKRR